MYALVTDAKVRLFTEKFIEAVGSNEELNAIITMGPDTSDFIYSYAVSLLRDLPWVWQGKYLSDFLQEWKVSEATFNLVYSVCSKILRTLKIGIKNVSAALKKINGLREQVIHVAPVHIEPP